MIYSTFSKRKRALGILFFTLLAIGQGLFAQTSFANKHLADLMTELSVYQVPADFVGERYIPQLSNDKPIVAQQEKPGITCHIGLKLFDRELMTKHPSPLYHFVERYFLELLMSENNAALQDRMKQERVKLTSECYPKAPLLEGIRQIVEGFSTEHSILINCSNHRYTLVATDGKKEVFSFEFPVRYELITGENKLEAESSIYPRLLLHSPSNAPVITSADLSTYKDTLFVHNDDYYMTENIRANSYYQKSGDEFTPIFDKGLLSESIYNLFNSTHKKDIQLEVTQKLYGNKSNTFTINLPIMMDFLRSQRCQIYSGIRKMEGSHIEGVVLAVNTELGYQHVWTFTMNADLFTSTKEQTIQASMYSYIPIHNVSTIFGK